MKADLQIHSTFSDGKRTPTQLVELAIQGGVTLMSLTDHDTTGGIAEARLAAQKTAITFVAGVEISTLVEQRGIHILGYGIEETNQSLTHFLGRLNAYRQERFLEQFHLVNANLRVAGKEEIEPGLYSNLASKYYSHPGLALFLHEQGRVAHQSDGFIYGRGVIDTVPHVTPEEAIAAIHAASGIAVLSHPLAPKISLREITEDPNRHEAYIAKWKDAGLDGIECYQAGHSADDVAQILSYAQKYSLFVSAGSDWHGPLAETGDSIKKYLPFYKDALGDLEVPEEVSLSLTTRFLALSTH